MRCQNCHSPTEFRQVYCSENCAMEAHDREHPKEECGEFAAECSICDQRCTEAEEERQKRALDKMVEADIDFQEHQI